MNEPTREKCPRPQVCPSDLPNVELSGLQVGCIVLGWLGFTVASGLVYTLLMPVIEWTAPPGQRPFLSSTLLIMLSSTSLLIAILLVGSSRTWTFAALGLRPTTWRWLAIGISGGLGFPLIIDPLIAHVYELAAHLFGLPSPATSLNSPPLDYHSGLYLVYGLLASGVVGPLAEEILFRGIIYRWLRTRFSVRFGVVASATVFALFHLFYPVMALAAVFLMGVAAAILYQRSGSLWPAIALHSLNNAIVAIAPWWVG